MDGFPAGPHFVFAAIALLAGALDLRSALRPPSGTASRLAGHLWRMGFALLLATASFFGGPGVQAFPEPLRDSPLLLVPQLAVAGLLVYWLARVPRSGRRG